MEPLWNRSYRSLLREMSKVILIVIAVTLFLNYDWGDSLEEILTSLIFNTLLTLGLWFGNGVISSYVKISWVKYPLRRFVVSFVLTIIVTLVVAAAMWLLLDLYCCQRPVLEALASAGKGYYISVLIITFLISLFLHGKEFLQQWKESIVETEQLKQAHLVSRYESLKNQVNPHFLFNSFNVLSNLVHKDADLAEKFIRQLAKVYRYVLQTREQEVVSLQTEMEALEAYLFLLKIRFGEALQVELQIEEDAEWMVAPLSVQMLVENAVKHNIVSKSRPLQLLIKTEGEDLLIQNNLQIKKVGPDSVGVGLANIRDRYQYLIDREIQVQAGEDFFTVRLPRISIQKIVHESIDR